MWDEQKYQENWIQRHDDAIKRKNDLLYRARMVLAVVCEGHTLIDAIKKELEGKDGKGENL